MPNVRMVSAPSQSTFSSASPKSSKFIIFLWVTKMGSKSWQNMNSNYLKP